MNNTSAYNSNIRQPFELYHNPSSSMVAQVVSGSLQSLGSGSANINGIGSIRSVAEQKSGPSVGANIRAAQVSSSNSVVTNAHGFRGHHRRQSVARLLPDISKLRLMSWLVEASSELINCDIVIMDAVYAKLNKSRESSFLFWNHSNNNNNNNHNNNHHHHKYNNCISTTNKSELTTYGSSSKPIHMKPQGQRYSLATNQMSMLPKRRTSNVNSICSQSSSSSRNHHSLPPSITSYKDAIISMSPKEGSRNSITSTAASTSNEMPSITTIVSNSKQLDNNNQSTSSSLNQQNHLINQLCSSSLSATINENQLQQQKTTSDSYSVSSGQATTTTNNNNNKDTCDSNSKQTQQQQPQAISSDDDAEEEDDRSSTTSSSGINGGTSMSLSSTASTASSTSESNGNADVVESTSTSNSRNQQNYYRLHANQIQPSNDITLATSTANSAELLSEKVRRSLMEHNYLQTLLVNVIRQYDQQRMLQTQQRQPQTSSSSYDHANSSQYRSSSKPIDLAELAELLNDACMCICHSNSIQNEIATTTTTNDLNSNDFMLASGSSSLTAEFSAAPANSTASSINQDQQQTSRKQVSTSIQAPVRKLRRFRKQPTGASNLDTGQKQLATKQDFVNQMSDRLCENCFEVHYWLHGCSLESMITNQTSRKSQAHDASSGLTSGNNISATSTLGSSDQTQELDGLIQKRNATFIRLVQQRVSSTIRESLNLIELIRKEIKCPESIKQKQLMHCFSASIQLLSSVGNYVVSAQDIPTFIPDLGQKHTTKIYRLPPFDFDESTLITCHPSSSYHYLESDYHLAQAPEVPIRRKYQQQKLQHKNLLAIRDGDQGAKSDQRLTGGNVLRSKTADQLVQSDPSSSGNSSSNSSASSSIARGDVQQSSLTRLNMAKAGRSTTVPYEAKSKISGLDMSFGARYSSLSVNPSNRFTNSRAHNDELMTDLEESNRKFWQSPKFNFIKKLLRVKEQRLLRQQSKDRRIYNNKVQNKFRLVMMDLSHFTKSQQLLTTENGLNSMLTSMRHVLEFGLFLTVKLY